MKLHEGTRDDAPKEAALKIHESTRDDGSLAPVTLRFEDGAASIVADDGALALPAGAIEAVMARFGLPLEASARVREVAALRLDGGRSLAHVRHLARYDVVARDYLVYAAPGRAPVCALATTVAGALDHLGRAAARGAGEPALAGAARGDEGAGGGQL